MLEKADCPDGYDWTKLGVLGKIPFRNYKKKSRKRWRNDLGKYKITN